jgi:hypothetical protein
VVVHPFSLEVVVDLVDPEGVLLVGDLRLNRVEVSKMILVLMRYKNTYVHEHQWFPPNLVGDACEGYNKLD